MKNQKKPFYKRWWFIVIVVILVIGLGSQLASPSKEIKSENSITEKESEDVVTEEKTEYNLGEIISTKDFDLIFDNARIVNDFSGKENLVIDVTIQSKKDNYSFLGDIQGVTSDNEIIDTALLITNEDLGDPIGTVWTKKLNTGQKAKGYVGFDKNINKMELRSNMFQNDVLTINLGD